MNTFAVVGGGASGVLMAVQLLRQDPAAEVELFEARGALGAGVAYATGHPAHLLNVPASGMSAFADDPEHFLDWLTRRGDRTPAEPWGPDSFVPRRLYRDYLASLAEPYLGRGDGRLRVHRAEVADIVEEGGVAVLTSGGDRVHAAAAVLATGNEGPVSEPAPWRRDFWSSSAGFDFPPGASVAVVGTGLSMVDSVMSLLDAGHAGSIVAVSRHGLLPRPHDDAPPASVDLPEVPAGASIAELARWLRSRARTVGNWRAAVDGLRPRTQSLWAGLPEPEKRRFLRHARVWWDVHRHRMAPQIHRRIEAARASGQLAVIAARVFRIEPDGGRAAIRIRRRGGDREETIAADFLVDCRGHNPDAAATGNPLLRRLLDRGTIRPDPLHLGLDVTGACAVIGRSGAASSRIFAVGPITKGRFWEIVAIPDIRLQVRELAGRLLGTPAADG